MSYKQYSVQKTGLKTIKNKKNSVTRTVNGSYIKQGEHKTVQKVFLHYFLKSVITYSGHVETTAL